MHKPGSKAARLVEIMDRLLAPDGCAWDREQTLDSLRPYLIEETYEVADAMITGDVANHREELGDLLMQIVFQAAIRQREGAFGFDDVADGIADKLVRRHPHIFADATASTSAEVLAQWDVIKAQEQRDKAAQAGEGTAPPRLLDGVPRSFPALVRAQKIGHKAGKVGFDWPGWEGSLAKVEEEIAEVRATAVARDRQAAHGEIGDLLFAVVNLARKLEVDAELALADATDKFRNRFGQIEDKLRATGTRAQDCTLAELDALWDEVKRGEPGHSPSGTAIEAGIDPGA